MALGIDAGGVSLLFILRGLVLTGITGLTAGPIGALGGALVKPAVRTLPFIMPDAFQLRSNSLQGKVHLTGLWLCLVYREGNWAGEGLVWVA